jgi:hypothetical protein
MNWRTENMSKTWKMPQWMEKYREYITNTGGNSIEEIMSDYMSMDDKRGSNMLQTNLPKYLIILCVSSQVNLLEKLWKEDMIGR